MSDVINILLDSAQNAFLQVGVFVGAMLLFFGYMNYRYSGALINAIRKHKKLQVVFGSLLGMSPGCGGAIFVMPLYLRGTVTYGTVVATLISTMGDSSFVIISKMPIRAIYIHLISITVGIVTGYLIDAVGIGRNVIKHRDVQEKNYSPDHSGNGNATPRSNGDNIQRTLLSKSHEIAGTLGYEITHKGCWLWWSFCGMGFILGVILLFQQDVNQLVGFNLNLAAGLLGAGLSTIWMVAGHHSLADDTYAEAKEKAASLKEMLIHNAHETSFVTFWVFIAYTAYALFMHFTQIDLGAVVARAGFWPVVATACVGLIPGCGPQIVIVTLYTEGIVPFSALVAHTLSQDGDALFPILAMKPRAAVWLTITTTIPALIVGAIFYLAGL